MAFGQPPFPALSFHQDAPQFPSNHPNLKSRSQAKRQWLQPCGHFHDFTDADPTFICCHDETIDWRVGHRLATGV